MLYSHVRLSILPDAGGEIGEFVDRRSGRNWLCAPRTADWNIAVELHA